MWNDFNSILTTKIMAGRGHASPSRGGFRAISGRGHTMFAEESDQLLRSTKKNKRDTEGNLVRRENTERPEQLATDCWSTKSFAEVLQQEESKDRSIWEKMKTIFGKMR